MNFRLLDDLYNRAYIAYNMRVDPNLKQNDVRIDLAARRLLMDRSHFSEADIREKKVQVLKAYFSSIEAGVDRTKAGELGWLVNATNLFGEVQQILPNVRPDDFRKTLQENLEKVKEKFPQIAPWDQFSSALLLTQNVYASKHLPMTICNKESSPLNPKKGALDQQLMSNEKMQNLAERIDQMMDGDCPMSLFAELIAVHINIEIKSILYASKGATIGADEIMPAKETLLLLMKNDRFLGAINELNDHLETLTDPQYASLKKEVFEYKIIAENLQQA